MEEASLHSKVLDIEKPANRLVRWSHGVKAAAKLDLRLIPRTHTVETRNKLYKFVYHVCAPPKQPCLID